MQQLWVREVVRHIQRGNNSLSTLITVPAGVLAPAIHGAGETSPRAGPWNT